MSLLNAATAVLHIGMAVVALYVLISLYLQITRRLSLVAQFHAKDYGSVQYNFHPDGTARGTIPDPSDELLQEYYKELRELFRESGIDDLPSEAEIRANRDKLDEIMEKIEKFDRIETHHSLLEIIAKLCQNQPSVDDMMQLPYRKRVKFVRFVQKELTDPEV